MAVGEKTLATNKKARHEYFIEETYECGIELKGTEVKSIRAGRVNLKEGFASVDNSEVFLWFRVRAGAKARASVNVRLGLGLS